MPPANQGEGGAVADNSLRHPPLFVAASEERSFTAAARRETAAQSCASQHIRKLEEASGVPLFVRGTSERTIPPVTPAPLDPAGPARHSRGSRFP